MAGLTARLNPYRRLVERADQNHWLRLSVYAFVVLSPALMLVAASIALQLDFRHFVPIHSDSTFYWHQAKTFAAVGFDGGYYTYGEVPPRLPGIQFYAWGPFVPMLYGSLGRVFGWYPESLVVINTLLMMGALALFVSAVRPVWWQALAIPVVYGHSVVFLYYLSISMVVMLHYAIAIALAAGFYRLMKGSGGTGRRVWWVGTGLLIIGASLLVPIWAPIAMVYFLIAFRGRGWGWTSMAIGLTAVLFASATLLYIVTAAPFPNALPPFLPLLTQDLGAALQSWVAMIGSNLSIFLNDDWLYASAMRLGALLIVAAALWHVLKPASTLGRKGFDWIVHLANLLPVLILYLTIYFQFGQMIRQLAPRMVLSSLLLLMFGRLRLLGAVILVSSIALFADYRLVVEQFRNSVNPETSALYDDWHSRLERVLQHVPNSPSQWCNSLVLSADVADHFLYTAHLGVLMAVPPGIGLSLHTIPERARYGLLDDETYHKHREEVNLVLLMEVPGGGLYLNLDSDCPLPADDVLERARNAGA